MNTTNAFTIKKSQKKLLNETDSFELIKAAAKPQTPVINQVPKLAVTIKSPTHNEKPSFSKLVGSPDKLPLPLEYIQNHQKDVIIKKKKAGASH